MTGAIGGQSDCIYMSVCVTVQRAYLSYLYSDVFIYIHCLIYVTFYYLILSVNPKKRERE